MLFTGHGDAGYTHVIGGPLLPKCDTRLEALGVLDEAQAQLGVARALLASTPWAADIQRIQNDLRLVMADIAIISSPQGGCQYLTDEHLTVLESDLARWENHHGGFLGFSTPGNSLPEAHLHLARTIIRRAERTVVALFHGDGSVNPLVLRYLNRLSSWVYALTLLIVQ